jgi:uncharacterized Tic20 family protein
VANVNPHDPYPHQEAAAGWFPVGDGLIRYWDGTMWTDHVASDPRWSQAQTSDERTMAILCHVGGAFMSLLVPLIIFLIKRDESPFVRHHALEALNFHMTFFLISIVSFVLVLVVIGIVLLFAAAIIFFVLSIIASMAASRGEWYRYPLTLRLFT